MFCNIAEALYGMIIGEKMKVESNSMGLKKSLADVLAKKFLLVRRPTTARKKQD